MEKRAPRVLLVDDDAAARQGLESLLLDEGYEVLTAADGQDAWEKLPSFVPDAVLTDIKMPRLDGIALLRQIRSALPELPVVLMTGLTEKELARTSAEDLPRVFALSKPVEVEALIEVLARLTPP